MKVVGCRLMRGVWDKVPPFFRQVVRWQVQDDPKTAMCPKLSRRRKSDGHIELEIHPVSKNRCVFCEFAVKA